MAAPRPHWKGFLKLSLVSCPIGLYPAISPAERISFRQVNRETGNRLRQQLVDTVTGEPVERHNTTRGYQVGEDKFLTVEEEELNAARQQARTRPFSIQPEPNKVSTPSEKDEEQFAPTPRGRVASPKVRHEEPLALRREEPMLVPSPASAVSPPVRVENNHTIEIERFAALGRIRLDQLGARVIHG